MVEQVGQDRVIKPSRMRAAVLYARVSSKEHEKEGFSIPRSASS